MTLTEERSHPRWDLESLNPAQVKAAAFADLDELAADIRGFLVKTVSRTGGHIGANLGTVELSIALHRVFDSPLDKIVWDTGHQGYAHKIVTGRAARFASLNTYGGLSRFVSKSESAHDIIEASHGGTSVSIALGLALAMKLAHDGHYAIAVVGDGAFTEGLTLEALNHAAVERDANLIVVLNDNGYAISPGFGGLHEYLEGLPLGGTSADTFFSALGMEYIGPIDGHSVEQVTGALEAAKSARRPPIVHVKTIKGRGLPAADAHPFRMHFSFPFDPESGKPEDGWSYVGYQDVAARVIGELMSTDERIVAITPSTLYASGLAPVFARFPDRCFDPGMEEQHAMCMTVGFALMGFKPVIVYQSTFMQRAFDQILHDVCFANLPTLMLAVRSGFAGYDNPTHHGIYDFAYLGGLPNLRFLYPKDRFELERMVRGSLGSLGGPTVIAMPYGPVDECDPSVLEEPDGVFAQPQQVCGGDDLLIVTVGHKFGVAREVASELRAKGIACGLVNLRYLKPLPEEWLSRVLGSAKRVVSLEEWVLSGGVGSALGALILDRRLECELLRIGVPCQFVEPGSNEELCRIYRLDTAGVLARIRERWGLSV
jgi:1-deoxy-D-xylulose-5-phosphate synthase